MDCCSSCKTKIHVPPWKKKGYSGRKPSKNFFCSRSCYQKWWKKIIAPRFKGVNNIRWSGGKFILHCLTCAKSFGVTRIRKETAKFCSHSCRAKFFFTGPRNPMWAGGIQREKREELPQYRTWRKMVYRRDRWKCMICGYRGRELVAHHLRVWKSFPKQRFSVENGITLCRGCHCRIHTVHRDITDFREILRDYMPNRST